MTALEDFARTLDATAIAALTRALSAMPEAARARGRAHVRAGRLRDLLREAHGVRASVREVRSYVVRWSLADGAWRSSCSCPRARDCEHAAALAERVLDAAAAAHPAREARDARASHQALETLARWASAPPLAPRSLRGVLGLRPGPGGVEVTLQMCVTGPRLVDAPRTPHQLAQLAGDLRASPGLLSPPQARLLRAVTSAEFASASVLDGDRIVLGVDQFEALFDRVPETPFLSWDPALPVTLAHAYAIEPGARARLDGADLRIVPEVREGAAGAELALAFEWPDGRLTPLGTALLVERARGLWRATAVAAIGGTFHRILERPPGEALERLSARHAMPVHSGDLELLESLERFPSVAHALRSRTRAWPSRAVVCLDLRANDWLSLRLFADASGGAWRPFAPPAAAPLFEFEPPGQWARVTRPRGSVEIEPEPLAPAESPQPPAGEDVTGAAAAPAGAPAPTAPAEPAPTAHEAPWIERPEGPSLGETASWLRATGARAGAAAGCPEPDSDRGWWVRLASRSLATVADAWDERPLGVAWFANARARELVRGRRVAPRVSVTGSGLDWFSVSASWTADGAPLDPRDLEALRASREPFVKLSSGWVRRESDVALEAAAEALADLGLDADGREQRVTLWQLAQARPGSLETLAHAGLDAGTLDALATLRARVATFAGLPRVEPPAALATELRPYQREGLDFLAWNASLGLGAVLADDMGLGKTVQTLAWLLHLKQLDPRGGPTLVVCPASVMHHWEREAERFAPTLRTLRFASGAGRSALREQVPHHDLVVTNYALLRRDAEFWRGVPLRAAVLDEAQQIKNPGAAVTRAAQSLDARHRLALTGTPLENRVLDLWSILSFVEPGYLGPRTRFVARFDRPDAPAESRRLLAARLRPVMLRRLKAQVAPELPDRVEERRDCPLVPAQRRLYAAEAERGRELLRRLSSEPASLAKQRLSVLAVLTRLRQICCHPALVGAREDAGSGKFDELFDLLEPLLAEGHKVLLYSQFVECLELIRHAFEAREIPYHMLTGRSTRRERLVQAFADDPRPCVFLLSLKAGGLGLNLTQASYVILFDPWWNPAVEAQAIDRTHRIGQTRTVVAYRLLAEGTLEERIWDLQQRKLLLTRDVLDERAFARALTRDDLAYLLGDAGASGLDRPAAPAATPTRRRA